jgi:DNA modification methylase
MQWVWTDPPYNVNYGDKAASLNKAHKGHRNCSKIMNDNMSTEKFLLFLRSMFVAVHDCMDPGAAIYVAHAETERANFTVAFLHAGFKLSTNIIWKKNQLVLGCSDWQYIHEPILYGWKTGAAHHWVGGRKNVTVQEIGETVGVTRTESGTWLIPAGDEILELERDAVVAVHPTTVLSVPKPQRNDVHPTMKPVALVERCLRFSAPSGSVGADAFGGSGTTLIAAERLGLRSRLMEMDPKYCDVIVKRWQNYTGISAVHAVSGDPFPAV